jgi:hypothetical protein
MTPLAYATIVAKPIDLAKTQPPCASNHIAAFDRFAPIPTSHEFPLGIHHDLSVAGELSVNVHLPVSMSASSEGHDRRQFGTVL